ncbi:MAG: SDR family NAD(P)-dependent oxidoreductase [Nitrospirota bacterium]
MRKAVIVTGASRGLGREVALAFGRAGWCVAVNYSSSHAKAEAVAEEIISSGGDALVFQADVGNGAQAQNLVNAAEARWGRLDALINNAGVSREALLLRLTGETLDETLRINLKGPFNMMQAASKVMMRRNCGHIINVASIAGIIGKAGHAAYAASKAGLIGLTKAAAIELAPHGVQSNCVLPGYMLTEMGEAAQEKAKSNALSDSLLKIYSNPAEVASFILGLTNLTSVSGQIFNLDSRVI